MSDTFEIIRVIASIVSALAASIAAVMAKRISKEQNEIHKDSYKPYCDMWCVDLKDRISISIRNNGTGVMQITGFKVYKKDKVFEGLYDYNCINKSIKLNYYSVDIIDRSIKPYGELKLIEKTDGSDTEFEQLRNDLKKCSIEIEYVDMYNKPMPICKKKLSEIYGKKHRQ